MRAFFFLLFNFILLAFALATGAFFLIIFATIIAGMSLFFFLYMKITGRLPGNIQLYRFEQHTREESAPLSHNVIEAEYEEIRKDA